MILTSPTLIASFVGENARYLQQMLRDAGYPLKVDGKIGPETLAAFARFKRDAHLGQPATLGVASLQALELSAKQRREGLAPSEASETKAIAQPATSFTTKILPSGRAVYVEKPVIDGGNFAWSEFTKGGSRWPTQSHEEGNIIKIARSMEEVRSRLGNKPINITSGFRPLAINKAVGGARNSRHVPGDAVDFSVPGVPVGEVKRKLEDWWGDRGGFAVSYRGGFTHVDCRGYLARWAYS